MNTMIQTDQEISRKIIELVRFGLDRQMLEPWDRIPVTNALLALFGLDELYDSELEQQEPAQQEPAQQEPINSATAILEKLLDYAFIKGILPENTNTYRDLLDAKIMGLLLPRQSEMIRLFWTTAEKQSIQKATDDYYQLSIDSNYIRMDRIQKNVYWRSTTDYGDLEITINLSKPEKDPKEIAAERNLPQSSYPKCLLCVENVGYAGRLNHPARQNHRVIPLQLGGATWLLQYSPYVYYNEHSIIFNELHVPMKISRQTFARLLDFVDLLPHYFIGSNADLPIVGGSILNHDHFQGGRHQFPMEKALVGIKFTHPDFPGLQIGIVKWPMSVIRVSGFDRNAVLNLADLVYESWKGYSDPNADIIAETQQQQEKIPHNTVTPIVRKNAEGAYEIDLVLRNNRTSDAHPLGIFHPHQELHHIKKENIGLIEVMGLAVLPGRLKAEVEQITQILTGSIAFSNEIKGNPEHTLHKHADWIVTLAAKYGTTLSEAQAEQIMMKEIGHKFLCVLEDAGVYKRDQAGVSAFRRFMQHVGFN